MSYSAPHRTPWTGPRGPRSHAMSLSISERGSEAYDLNRFGNPDYRMARGSPEMLDQDALARIETLEAQLALARIRIAEFEAADAERRDAEARAAKQIEQARMWNTVLVAKYGREAELAPMGTVLPYIRRAHETDGLDVAELLKRIDDLGGAAPDDALHDNLRIYLLSLLGVPPLPAVKLSFM
ncbi:hypothetical protein CspeluHIS016_0802420 [Cutaneotrichosporon spelunceum]|uniref:Uncharacterized protein n=1 Tax=Cutaneotrichosporon spelunceum TaxID=1672016 RepID=A0AAD3TZ97_9TREE|nr:hypothetical protein CspeluHIS016_0802420 [Cutaneotrichosporon spelunceum]